MTTTHPHGVCGVAGAVHNFAVHSGAVHFDYCHVNIVILYM